MPHLEVNLITITNSEFRKLMIDKLKTINGAFEKKIAPLIEGMDDNLLDHSKEMRDITEVLISISEYWVEMQNSTHQSMWGQ